MKLTFLLPSLACPILLAGTASTVLAQTTKVFVASYGNNANDGSRLSPKRTFQAAHNAVFAGGQIVVLDLASYNDLTITKSVAITVPPGVNGIITVAGSTAAITINAGASDTVSLRGLIIEGSGSTINDGTGIYATQVGTLRVEDCTIRSFAQGIFLDAASSSHFVVQGGSVRDTLSGIAIQSGATGIAVDAVITGCTVDKASLVALSTYFVAAGATGKLTASGCVLTHNGTALSATGSGGILYTDACTVSGNTTGIATSDSGQVITRSTNTFFSNTSDGTFSGTLSAK